MDTKSQFQDRFQRRMQATQVSGADLARELGVKPPTIVKYKNGTAAPSLDVLAKMSIALNCTTDYLLGLTDEEGRQVAVTDELNAIEREMIVFFKGQTLADQTRLLEIIRLAAR